MLVYSFNSYFGTLTIFYHHYHHQKVICQIYTIKHYCKFEDRLWGIFKTSEGWVCSSKCIVSFLFHVQPQHVHWTVFETQAVKSGCRNCISKDLIILFQFTPSPQKYAQNYAPPKRGGWKIRHLTVKSRCWYFNDKKLWCINIWFLKNHSHEKAKL